MADRIARHKAERGAGWRTVETPLAIVDAIRGEARAGEAILVDCLTLWLSNLFETERDVAEETEALCDCLRETAGHVILVSNEIGLGLVPESALGRSFRDAQGRLNQAAARAADRVEFMVAGLPLVVKG